VAIHRVSQVGALILSQKGLAPFGDRKGRRQSCEGLSDPGCEPFCVFFPKRERALNVEVG
jgi:hypothetical protein